MAGEEATCGMGGRQARIMAAVTEHDTAAGVGEMAQRLCRLAMKMALPGCALVLMPQAESASVLARLRAAVFANGRRCTTLPRT